MAGLGRKAAAVLAPDRLAAFRARENTARQTFEFGTANAFAPPEQMQATIEQLKPVPGSETYAANAQLFDQVKADIGGALDAVRWEEIESTHGASPAAMRIATELMAAGRVGQPGLPFGPILAYADAVETREALPNSMARLAFRRDSYPDLDDAAADAAIDEAWRRDGVCRLVVVEMALVEIKRLPQADTWRAIDILMSQNQDYDLVAIASELALRVDRARFEQLARTLAEGRSANAAMFDHVREHGRWSRRGW